MDYFDDNLNYDFEEDFDYEEYMPNNQVISPNAIMKYEAITDVDALRDKFSIVSFYVAVYECFQTQIVGDIMSVYCMPDAASTLERIKYEKSPQYKTEVLNLDVYENGEVRGKDKLRATMLWLVKEKCITEDDYKLFVELRKLRNDYVHNMASYIINPGAITLEKYECLRALINLFKKIEVWFIKNIEMERSAPVEEYEQHREVLDQDIEIPIISLFTQMADKLCL